MTLIKNNYKYILLAILTTFSVHEYVNIYIKIILFIVFIIFYKKLYVDIKISRKYQVLDIIMSFILVLGYSYDITSTGYLFYGSINNLIISIIKIIGYYYFIKTIIYYLIKFLNSRFKDSQNKIIQNFSKRPFLYSFIFLSICYGIYLIAYYPGIINYDNANQIKQVFGIHTKYLDAVVPISSSTLTNFHPIIHTLLLGGVVKFGLNLGNFNFGLFIYTLFQMLIVILIYCYVISYSIKNKCNNLISFITLLFIGIVPLFGFYSITAVKDTLYSVFLLLFSLKIYDFLKKDNFKVSDYVFLFIVSILVCLLRNNGFFVVIFTLVFLIFGSKIKGMLSILLMVFLSYFAFNNVLLPMAGISGTSIREALSIPFQQTARLATFKNYPFTKKEEKIISKILDYENLSKDYNEDLSDPVKNKYNRYADKKDLINYFGVWFKGLVKYPVVYVDATINNISGYFYPFDNSWKIYHKLNPKLPEAGFNYHYNNLVGMRKFLYNYEIFMECSPFGIFLNIGVITWLSIFLFIVLCNKYKNYIFLIPSIITIIFCVLGPANTYYRYIYPSLILMVLLFPLIKLCIENIKDNK